MFDACTVSSLGRFALVSSAVLGSLIVLSAAGASTAAHPGSPARAGLVEVVVTLPQPPLALAVLRDRQLAARTTRNRRLDVRVPASVSYLRSLASAQRTLQTRIRTRIPAAVVRWHYGVVLNGIAVALPPQKLADLRREAGPEFWDLHHDLIELRRTDPTISAARSSARRRGSPGG